MDNQTYNQGHAVSAPSLFRLNCPRCGTYDYQVLGKKGAKGKAIGVGAMFGAVGDWVASSISENNFNLEPMNYKCKACGAKFESVPLLAQPDEILQAPCRIIFTRMSGIAGMGVAQSVWLNGVKVAAVGNGETKELVTYIRYNTLFVTDQYGVAFADVHKFEASAGGYIEVRFNRKFV